MQKTKNYAILLIHIAVFLWGFTGILGNAISLNAFSLVWWRLLFCSFLLLPFCIPKLLLAYTQYKKYFLYAIVIGFILALHWVTFYLSLKLASVSIAVVCLSSTAFFTYLIEFVIHKKKFSINNLMLSILCVIGISIIFKFETQYRWGILIGTLSSILNAMMPIYNKPIIEKLKPFPTLTIEFISGLIFLGIGIFIFQGIKGFEFALLNQKNIWLLLILSTLCTAIPFYFAFYALQYIEPFTENIIVNLEPIYTIIIAFIFFNESEKLGMSFYFGGGIILLTVMIQTLNDYNQKRK